MLMIDYVSPRTEVNLVNRGDFLQSAEGDESYPIVRGIPRFVESEDYAASFGFQWNLYRETQLDSKTGTNLSKVRLERCLGIPLTMLQGRSVLEAGCGAGRFTELLVAAGALVHSIDISTAVDANKSNIGEKPNYSIAQADIRAIPYPQNSFDYVICLGVLQHTPSPEESCRSLWRHLKPGGMLVIDHYKRPMSTRANPLHQVTNVSNLYRPILRTFLKNATPEKSQQVVMALVNFFFPLHWRFRNNRVFSKVVSRLSPCAFYYGLYPELAKEHQYAWSLLDTFDGLTDFYKHLRTPDEIRQLLEQLGAEQIYAGLGGNGVEARALKPSI
jgi:2-polyprenyl-3-methyl-5-hydroxy-6-metoxy-1,4-benzoquinol methylase